MPSLSKYFDWRNFEISAGADADQVLATKDMKSIFTTAARFMGYGKLLMEQPNLNAITNEFLGWNEKLLKKFPQISLFIIGDDVAGNRGLLLSPDNWRSWIKPELSKLIDLAHSYKCKVVYHSDGDIAEIVQDLSDLGVYGINFQPIGRMSDCMNWTKYQNLNWTINSNPWEGLFVG